MANKQKFHRQSRDAAVARLLDVVASGNTISTEMWRREALQSGYSVRRLQGLVHELQAQAPLAKPKGLDKKADE